MPAETGEPSPAARPQPSFETVGAQAQGESAAYRARPAAQGFALPSDLVQVETSSAAPASELTAIAEPQLPRRPRRPAPEPVASEPLVQIETRSDGEPG
jgi:hypothetical protein